MAKTGKDDASCFGLLKDALNPNEDLNAAARVTFGVIGIVGTVTIDPVMKLFRFFGIRDDNPAPDPNDPSAPSNQNY